MTEPTPSAPLQVLHSTPLLPLQDADVPDADEVDEVDQLIEAEHGKYQERRELWQEKLRASRPWSAPALGSPRPETQRRRDKEREAAASKPEGVCMNILHCLQEENQALCMTCGEIR